jgi:hypothetical protein
MNRIVCSSMLSLADFLKSYTSASILASSYGVNVANSCLSRSQSSEASLQPFTRGLWTYEIEALRNAWGVFLPSSYFFISSGVAVAKGLLVPYRYGSHFRSSKACIASSAQA